MYVLLFNYQNACDGLAAKILLDSDDHNDKGIPWPAMRLKAAWLHIIASQIYAHVSFADEERRYMPW